MFGFRKRTKRRKPQDPVKQIGKVAGKAIGAVVVGAILNMFRKK
jgi:uncharacterized protein YcfJ